MKPAALLLLLLGSIGAFAATLVWVHPSIGQPATFTMTSPRGQIVTVTNLVVTFYVYRTTEVTNSNWTIITNVVQTNTVWVPSPSVKAFYMVSASNSYSGETPFFSPVGVANRIVPATETQITEK